MDKFENNRNIETLNITKGIGYAKVDSQNDGKPYAHVIGYDKNTMNRKHERQKGHKWPQR